MHTNRKLTGNRATTPAWLLLPLILALPLGARAQFTFTTNSGVLTITAYTGPGGAVVVPSSTNSHTVVSIGNNAFQDAATVTSITLPTSITNIGQYAFWSCSGLTTFTLPTTVTNLATGLFEGCTHLQSLTIRTNTTSVGDFFCYGCTSLANLTLPNTLRSIGNNAFDQCSALTAAALPTNLLNLATYAFRGCTKLANVTVPGPTTNVGSYAFYGCTALTGATIGKAVTSIGDRVFWGCTSLTAITVDINNTAYSSLGGVLFNKSQTQLVEYPPGLAGSYTVPGNVTTIDTNAFNACLGLTSITLSNKVTNLKDGAFGSCSNLTALYFQGNAPALGANVFFGDPLAIAYYQPNTTGWGTTYGGIPARLFGSSPLRIVTDDGNFGVRTNRFGFDILWVSNETVVVEARTNPAHGTWVPLKTNTFTSNTLYFSDATWTSYPNRVYRVRTP
ncbi:MAG TPA: leucine-rich repeat domain-containing protein [Candidatus Acidoferrum sp.]|nr:leucine-rich repeat domain-containing protein [Candidatus Acidoferrum sp.]